MQEAQQPIYYPILSIEPREVQFDRENIPNLRVINMQEEFRFIDDFTYPNIVPERYMISNFGRVFDRLFNQFVDFLPDQYGYPSFVINYYIDWNVIDSVAIRVDRAVMCTFNPIPAYNSTEVRHLDGNKNHYTRNNLEWFDPDKLPDHLVETICSRLQTGCLIKQLVEMFDVPREVIEDIRDGKRYTHIRRKYKINKKKTNVLLPGQVRQICEILEQEPNIDSSDIANRLNCTVSAVNTVRSGRGYTRISKDYKFKRVKPENDPTPILKDYEVRDICETFIKHPDWNNYKIALRFKCKPTQVRDIRLRKVHKDIIKDYHW